MTTSAQVVETLVNVITNSPSQDYTHPDNHTLPAHGTTQYCILIFFLTLLLPIPFTNAVLSQFLA